MSVTGATVESERLEREPRSTPGRHSRVQADRRFWLGVACAVALGAVVRFTYLFHGAPVFVRGDGFDVPREALRLADGLGYTSAFGDTGAETAHHPPGWVTLLAGVTEAGGRFDASPPDDGTGHRP